MGWSEQWGKTIFYTTRKPYKGWCKLECCSNSKSHLKVNGVVHSYVVKQLIYHLDLYSSSWLSTPKVSTPKPSQLKKKVRDL